MARLVEGVPEAQFRFKRVALDLKDFEPASQHLQTDENGFWVQKPFATRLLGEGGDRVTLLKDRLKILRDGVTEETPVGQAEWPSVLLEWFELSPVAST